jgi:hypothetical protein
MACGMVRPMADPDPDPRSNRAPFQRRAPFFRASFPATIEFATPAGAGSPNQSDGTRFSQTVADTKKIEDTQERKKVKRAARKKAAPKAKRTTPRGSNKKKVKKLVRGQSKR